MHIRYPKVRPLNSDDCEWILDWWTIVIQEKLDWANLSVRLEDWLLCVWSRSTMCLDKWVLVKWFRWAVDYIKSHIWINEYLSKNPTHRLYGEWLVKHSLPYPEDKYHRFRLFDIARPIPLEEDVYDMKYVGYKKLYEIAHDYGIDIPTLFYMWSPWDITIDEIKWFVWNTALWWDMWEWIVIKNELFVNKRWRQCHAKLVTDKFKEVNKIVFGWFTKGNVEEEINSKNCSVWRVMKIINKIEQSEDRKAEKKDTPRVMWMVYHDIIEECLWASINKKKDIVIDFGKLRRLVFARARTIFHDHVDWNLFYNYNRECQK